MILTRSLTPTLSEEMIQYIQRYRTCINIYIYIYIYIISIYEILLL